MSAWTDAWKEPLGAGAASAQRRAGWCERREAQDFSQPRWDQYCLAVDGEVADLTMLNELLDGELDDPGDRDAEKDDECTGCSHFRGQRRVGKAALKLPATFLIAWQIAGRLFMGSLGNYELLRERSAFGPSQEGTDLIAVS